MGESAETNHREPESEEHYGSTLMTLIVFFQRFALQGLQWNDAGATNVVAACAEVPWCFETPDKVTGRPMLARLDVALHIDVYPSPERSQ